MRRGRRFREELSEVDLSNPEDVKALIPDRSTEILVHFGEDGFSGPVPEVQGASAGVADAVSEAVVGGYAV